MSSKLPSSESKVEFLSDYNLRGIIGKGTFSIVKLGINRKTKEKRNCFFHLYQWFIPRSARL